MDLKGIRKKLIVIKRDCTSDNFNKEKIYKAILKAMPFGEGEKPHIAENIANDIENKLNNAGKEEVEIYDIEKMVFDELIKHKQKNTARAYEGYRQVRE